MPKKKNASALFEVISAAKQKNESTLDVPDWIQSPVGSTPAAPKKTKAKAEPIAPPISIADQKIDFSLNYVSIGIAAGGLILLLLFAFLIGRGSASPESAQPAGQQQLAAGLQEAGKHYLMIQLLDGSTDDDIQDASRIVAYLAKFDVQANYLRFGSDRLIVCSQQAFEDPQSSEAVLHADWVTSIGKKYSAETASKYKLRQAKPSTTGNQVGWPWYKLWPESSK